MAEMEPSIFGGRSVLRPYAGDGEPAQKAAATKPPSRASVLVAA
jgi:hypothetical protein